MSLGALSALFCLYTLILFPLFSVVALAQLPINGTVAVGSSLTAGDNSAAPWLSPSGDFAFGFHEVEGTTDRYLLSIWYATIPHKTIVWYPTDTVRGPISPVISGSKLLLTAQDGLLLRDPQGAPLWRSQLVDGGAVVYAVMNNTGNFMLRTNSTSTSSNSSADRLLWQSFDHPADTLLPGQALDVGKEFFSRHKENDFRRGRFQLHLLQNGNLVLNTINLPTKFAYDGYYETGTNNPVTDPGDQLVYNSSGYLYISRRSGDRFDLTERGAVPTVDGYHRATLNFDGIFSQYFYHKAAKENGSWSSIWHQPDNICSRLVGELDSGACGFNSICSLEDDGRPSCKCTRGFSLLDPSDEYGSCVPDTEISCSAVVDGETNSTRSSSEELYDFEVLSNINWPTGDYARLTPCNEECCRADCMNDCLCAVAISGGNDCWKKKLPLSNGRSFRNDDGTRALIKVKKSISGGSAPPPDHPPNHEDRNGLLITVSALLGTSVFVNFMFITASCIGFLFIYKTKFLKLQRSSGELETNVPVFTYKELEEATDNFKEELRSGAFGVVYKGRLKMGSSLTPVAIKRLDRLVRSTHDQCKDEEFKTEVKVIGQVHHKNLVRLLGICNEGEHRLLVYEFLSNGSLADFLFEDSKPSWHQRVQIACGIARGLVYLHEECSTKIIHCDIKPQNILLDDYYNARISDFGLAKLLKMDQTQTQTGIRGTRGYVAPEWFKSSPVTTKVDVYSFGVILLELICCRRNVDVEMGESVGAILTDLVCDCYEEGTAMEVVKDDVEAMNDVKTLERFMLVAIWCIQEDPSLRPSMRKVNQMLEGVVQLTLPPLPNKH